MKKIYLPLLCLFFLSSCSPHLFSWRADKNPTYMVGTGAKHLDASSINFQSDTLHADSASQKKTNISGITPVQPAIVKKRIYYHNVYPGKITLYRQLVGYTSYTDNHWHASYQYTIQKQGQSLTLPLTNRNIINLVQDNPLALHKALTARTYSIISKATVVTSLAGLAYIFLKTDNNSIRAGSVMVLVSVPTSIISHYIGQFKRLKTIVIYDR